MNHDNTRRQQGENLEKCNARAEDARRRQMKPRGDPVQRWAGAGRRSRHPKQAPEAGSGRRDKRGRRAESDVAAARLEEGPGGAAY